MACVIAAKKIDWKVIHIQQCHAANYDFNIYTTYNFHNNRCSFLFQ